MPGVWDLDLVNEWIDNVALTPIGKFYPTAVAKDTELLIQDVFSRLLDLVKDNKLKIIWEIRCPNCFLTLDQAETRDVNITLFCYECGEDIEITPEMVFPAFRVVPEYKTYVQGKKKQHEACRRVLGRFSRHRNVRCLI
ncbi:MAG: hypothetical protein ACYDEJ_02285 [Desulfitobacteriaceae bacterium]